MWKTLTIGACLLETKKLTSVKEMPYFFIAAVVSVFIYIIAAISLFGIAIAFLLLGVVLLTNAIMIGSIRGNGVRIHKNQFPEIYERVVSLSEAMDLKKVPDVFVIHSEGAFNAFATRFMGRNMVVIYSEVFELAREQAGKELDFIIAHELAHIKRNHVWKNILTMPANFIPFLAEAYSRACEYTCDRYAAHYIGDGAAAKRALTILSVGKVLYKDVDEHTYLEQIHSESNVAVWFSELLSTHPILPKRIQAVGQFMDMENTPNFQPNTGKIAIGAVISSVILFAAYIAAIFYLVFSFGILATFTSIFDDDYEIEDYEYETVLSDDATPLMEAAAYGDLNEVEALLLAGSALQEKDGDSTTALHYAVYNDEVTVADYLLKQGANPNDEDYFSTVLNTALLNGSYEIAELLYSFGADPAKADVDGYSAFDMLEVETLEEFEAFLFD